jgi:hypothetical protein
MSEEGASPPIENYKNVHNKRCAMIIFLNSGCIHHVNALAYAFDEALHKKKKMIIVAQKLPLLK